ncbi:helix-turn-helix domain-containing protein [Actinomadura kijaniata]|uniref:helix-turn-helix domain-containing protein n=1 Tax=Actinomadura kijaniata TaxID=46161 RepID=UPI003F1DEC58
MSQSADPRAAERLRGLPEELKVYTKEEAATILRVSVSWVERRAAARQIPFCMIGGGYRFTEAQLVEILAMNEHGTLPAPAVPIDRRRRGRRSGPPTNAPKDFVPLRPRPRKPGKRAS